MTTDERYRVPIAIPARRARRRAACLGLAMLISTAAAAADQESAAPEAPAGAAIPASPRATPWLDEVRAQRRAWEQRRKAAHDAFETRHRANDPWGAAQHDAWEDEIERRREARRQQMEQDREHFRSLTPAPPPAPWPELSSPQQSFLGQPPQSGSQPSESATEQHGSIAHDPAQGGPVVYPPGAPPRGPYSPQDWDNLWYYRGY